MISVMQSGIGLGQIVTWPFFPMTNDFPRSLRISLNRLCDTFGLVALASRITECSGARQRSNQDSSGSSFGRLTSEKLRTPLSIVFAFVATHNHFVLDRGGKVFKQIGPGDQAAAGRHRGRPPRPARAAQQLDGVLLDEAGLSQQREHRRSAMELAGERPGKTFTSSTATKLETVPTSRATSNRRLARQLDDLAQSLEKQCTWSIAPPLAVARHHARQ